MLIVKNYKHPRIPTQPTKHSLVVLHKENVVREYKNINVDSLNQLLLDYAHHKNVVCVNVANVSDL